MYMNHLGILLKNAEPDLVGQGWVQESAPNKLLLDWDVALNPFIAEQEVDLPEGSTYT